MVVGVLVCARVYLYVRESKGEFNGMHISGYQIMNDIHVGQIRSFQQYLNSVKKLRKHSFMQL